MLCSRTALTLRLIAESSLLKTLHKKRAKQKTLGGGGGIGVAWYTIRNGGFLLTLCALFLDEIGEVVYQKRRRYGKKMYGMSRDRRHR